MSNFHFQKIQNPRQPHFKKRGRDVPADPILSIVGSKIAAGANQKCDCFALDSRVAMSTTIACSRSPNAGPGSVPGIPKTGRTCTHVCRGGVPADRNFPIVGSKIASGANQKCDRFTFDSLVAMSTTIASSRSPNAGPGSVPGIPRIPVRLYGALISQAHSAKSL